MAQLRIGITGATGHLGRELVALGGVPLICDVTNYQEVERAVKDLKPHLIIHCAGMSDPDECEKNFEKTFQVNVKGTFNVVNANPDVPVVYISSDHIFDGKKGNYSEKDKPKPLSTYGFSKFGAEVMVVHTIGKVIRTSTNFPNENTNEYLSCGEIGGLESHPTFFKRSYAHIHHIAEGIWHFGTNFDKMPKIVNISGMGILSEYEFVKLVAKIFGFDPYPIVKRNVEARSNTKHDLAPRPHKAGLNVKLARKLGIPLYSAEDGLKYWKANQ